MLLGNGTAGTAEILLKEKKPPINALSANILEPITKSWQRIIDSPHLLRGDSSKNLPFPHFAPNRIN